MLVSRWIIDYVCPSPLVDLWFDLSPASQCQRGKGIQVSTLQPFIVQAEGAFVCYTLLDYFLRIAIPCQERAHPIC